MAERKPLFTSGGGWSEEMAVADTATFGGLTMGGDIVMASSKVTGLGAPALDGDAATKLYVDQQVISGGTVKEALLHENQLNDADGIYAAMGLYFVNTPAVADSVTIKNGSLTKTYNFVTNQGAESVATDVSRETSAITAMQRLVLRVNADVANTEWDLVITTDLDAINADGVVVVSEDSTAAGSSSSRIYGTFVTAADAQVVEFATGATPTVDKDYTEKASTNMASADPGFGRFGLRRQQVALVDGELHYVLNNDVIYGWDDSANQWNTMSGSASIPDATSASGGGTKGKLTMDSDLGLSISSGIAKILIDDTPDTLDVDASGLKVVGLPSTFKINNSAVSGNVTAANLTTLTGSGETSLHSHAGSSHSHAHSDLTSVTSDQHHTQAHTVASHSDTTATGAELETLTDTSNADALHVHDYASSGHGHAHGDLSGVTSDQHHAQSHTVASHSDTTATGTELETLTDGSNADGLHIHASAVATEAPKVENALNVDEAIVVADPVYFTGTGDRVGKARADADAKSRVMGVARTAQPTPGSPSEIVSIGECAGALTGATPGTPYFLGSAGGISTSLPGGGNRLILVGYAVSADDLWISIHDYGKKAA